MPIGTDEAKLMTALQGVDEQLNAIGDPQKLKNLEILKTEFDKTLNQMAKSSGMRDMKSLMGELSNLGIPMAKNFSQGFSSVQSFTNIFGTLAKSGFPGAGKAAGALAGPLGLVGAGMTTLGKTLFEFYQEATQARMALGKTNLQLGDLTDITYKTSIMYKVSADAANIWGGSIDDVKQSFSDLVSAGINPSTDNVEDMTSKVTQMKAAFGISNSVLGDSLKLFSQEYKIREGAINKIAGLTKGMKDLGITSNDYLGIVSSMSRQMIDVGISSSTISKQLNYAIDGMGLGLTRAKAYTQEMLAGPMNAGLGQRAYMAERMGIGGGNALAGAAMLKYAPMEKLGLKPGETMGSKAIEIGLKDMYGMTRDQFKSMSETQKYGTAEAIAQYAKQFGLSERTVMESFKDLGLDIRTPQDELQDISAEQLQVEKDQLTVMRLNTIKLGEARGLDQKAIDALIAGKYKTIEEGLRPAKTEKQVREEETSQQEKFVENLKKGKFDKWGHRIEEKYNGGMIPHYYRGIDSVPAMLTPGEGVLNNYNGVPAAGGPDGVRRLNQGQQAGSGGTQINVNIAIPILKDAIQQAIIKVLRENPNVLALG